MVVRIVTMESNSRRVSDTRLPEVGEFLIIDKRHKSAEVVVTFETGIMNDSS